MTVPSKLPLRDAAFEQRNLHDRILTEDHDEVEYHNYNGILEKFGNDRASLSPSRFPKERFAEFRGRIARP